MRKKTKNKLMIWMAGLVLTASAILFMCIRNYSATIWVAFSAYLLYRIMKMDIYFQEGQRWMWKSIKINKKLTNRLVIEQCKNEAMLANCKRYQDELKELREGPK